MSYRMFVLLLVVLVVRNDVIGVEVEQFTLADGRVLVGVYDKRTQVLSFVGPIKGAVSVKEEDILRREPAPAVVAKPAAKPAVKPAEKTAANPEKEVAKGEGEGEKTGEKPAPAAVDPNKILIEQQAAWIARKSIELKNIQSKLERTQRKVVTFRKQFEARAQAEGQYYSAERPEHLFLVERQVDLPRTGLSNTAVRGLVDECIKLIAERTTLEAEIKEGRLALGKLEELYAPKP